MLCFEIILVMILYDVVEIVVIQIELLYILHISVLFAELILNHFRNEIMFQ